MIQYKEKKKGFWEGYSRSQLGHFEKEMFRNEQQQLSHSKKVRRFI